MRNYAVARQRPVRCATTYFVARYRLNAKLLHPMGPHYILCLESAQLEARRLRGEAASGLISKARLVGFNRVSSYKVSSGDLEAMDLLLKMLQRGGLQRFEVLRGHTWAIYDIKP